MRKALCDKSPLHNSVPQFDEKISININSSVKTSTKRFDYAFLNKT
jgi:hypothetical protein